MKIIVLAIIFLIISIILLGFCIKNKKEKFNFTGKQCIESLNSWWNNNIVIPFREGKIKEEQVKLAYENIQPIKAWLIAPCISNENEIGFSIKDFQTTTLDKLEEFKNKLLEDWRQHFIKTNIDQAQIDEKEKLFMQVYNIEFKRNFENNSQNLCTDCIKPLSDWHEKNIKSNSNITEEKKKYYNKILVELSVWLAGPCLKKLWSKDLLRDIPSFSFEDIELLNNQIKTWWVDNIFTKYQVTPEQYQGITKMFMHELEICD